ncbi:MAG: PEP/pyruvate-binding domain-containing protein [Myxococcales bacterium]|jgi:CheY-like chemotaxis protein
MKQTLASPIPVPVRSTDPWYRTFHDLMPNRIREILLVSSHYDAFILEEDGRLTERIFTEYSELNLSTAPRITHVATGARAFELLAERRFDLVLTMVRIADTDVSAFAREVKQRYPSMPVVLLVLTEADLQHFPGGVDATAIDHVFWWTGDARILLAIVKLIEDSLNAPHDTATAGVRVIIVVEDSVRRYSSFLSLLYGELMTQSGSLVAEGVNDLQRLMRMRARPKLLLARTFEEAMALFGRYDEYVVALISDVRYPRGGEEDPQAGFDLVREIRRRNPDLAILLQSAEPENAARAAELGVLYADKNSSSLLKQIRQFVTESLGFGDFVFRMPDRREVARARDMYELEEKVRTVPGEALAFHATRNHFSIWLMARSMFALARQLRSRTIDEVGGTEGLRRYLLQVLEEARIKQQEGVITDFSARQPFGGNRFVRLGNGSIGGKARGLAFVNSLLVRDGMDDRYPGLRVRIPKSLAIPTDEYDKFFERNQIIENGTRHSEQEMLRRCLAGRLSDELRSNLRRAVELMRGPLAVRSSSLLEDSQLQPFAGIYATYMLPNNHPDPEVRFEQLCLAVKAVYASTFSDDARAYIAGTPYSIEEEKMAVLIQEVVGQGYGKRFYPAISGVAVSYNYYPVGHQKAHDGLAMAALGLGVTVVQGGAALQFSPSTPSVIPQFGKPKEYLQFGQSRFFALDMTRDTVDFQAGDNATLVQCDLSAAEEDGILGLVGSVYSYDDDLIRDNLSLPGPRVVTFNNILKWEELPLAPALAGLLKLFREGMGCPVEIEFAVDAGDWGRPARGPERQQPCLYVLQVRPQAVQVIEQNVRTEGFPPEEIFCCTDRSLGHGVVEGIRDIVYVKRQDLEAHETPQVAREVGEMNARLSAEKRPYLLIGPGRWGSSDPRLGVPVKWSEIAGAKVMVETDFKNRDVEPSQGSHFFHNVTSFRIGYLTLSNVDRRATAERRRCDFEWLRKQPAFAETAEVCHVRLESPLRIILDGRKSTAAILKPA